MMTDLHANHIHGSTGGAGFRALQELQGGATCDRTFTQVIRVSPVSASPTGENRLQANTQIAGVHAHAAVRMHAFPVDGSFWAYCPKTKTPRFQRFEGCHLR